MTRKPPQIQHARKEALLRVTQDLQYAVLEDDLCVYKHTTSSNQESGPKGAFKSYRAPNSVQGLARRKSIESFLKGRASHVTPVKDLLYSSPDVLKVAQERGYMAAAEAFGTARDDVFDLFEQGQLDLNGFARWDTGGHMLFDRFGEVLPVAVFFDYMNGNLRDGAYDLEKVIKVLSKRKGIVTPTGEPLRIEEVPSYNRSRGCYRHVQFIFQPTVQEMRLMWPKMRELNKNFPSVPKHQAIFELDLLGLRKRAAAKFAEYWMSDGQDTEESDENSEDD